jgi:hypothetical protein
MGVVENYSSQQQKIVPGIRFNVITGKSEVIINYRGYAYACRNRLCYRKNKKRIGYR